MQKISPFLWFNDQAEEAVNFYLSIFKDSKITQTLRYNAAGAEVSGRPQGSIMTIAFELEGQEFTALNGGPEFVFSQAISFVVQCKNQEEVDHYWGKLTAGGEIQPCGWLRDKYGVAWQIIPVVLNELLGDKDPLKSENVMKAMLQMKKLDIKTLQDAVKQT